MRKFLIKILSFGSLLILFFILNGIINYRIFSTSNINLKKTRVLIVGDSHPQTALDPEMFSNAQNISQISEPYVLTFWKITRILKEINPDTMIIGFAPHNLSGLSDLAFSNEQRSPVMFKRSYTIGNYQNIKSSLTINYGQLFKTLWKELCFYPKQNHNHFIGSFVKKEGNDISDWQNAINRHYYKEEKHSHISQISINYLDSIINICQNNKITPILVSNPVYKKYYKKIPSHIIIKYNHLKQKYEDQDILIIDKTNENIPDSLFFNSDHINGPGSEIFTKQIINLLK